MRDNLVQRNLFCLSRASEISREWVNDRRSKRWKNAMTRVGQARASSAIIFPLSEVGLHWPSLVSHLS